MQALCNLRFFLFFFYQVKRAHDPLRNEVQNLLGAYEDVKSVIENTSTKNQNLIGVVPQPSTPVSTKVKGGNPFAYAVKKQDASLPQASKGKQESKNIINGQRLSKHGNQKSDTSFKKVKSKESGSKTTGNVSHKHEERTGVFDQFQNWENVDSERRDTASIKNETYTKDRSHKERKDKRASSERDVPVKTEDRSSSNHKRKDSNNHSGERSKSRPELKEENHSVTIKKENQAHDTNKGTVNSESRLNGASSAASTPNSQKSTASSGYGSLKPTNSVISQPHTSPVREHRDSDASLKSTPSPDIPVFQSPPSRASNSGKSHPTASQLKCSVKLPNGVSKDIKKHRPSSDQNKSKGLKLDTRNQVRITRNGCN